MSFFFEESRKLSLLYRRLETCGKPFAAAIHGVCLGGAFELALACHHRVVSDGDSTRVGLPEVKVGLFPGAGGTQRVARLMPTGDALQMLFKGEQHRPLMARNMGLVHTVAPRTHRPRGEGVDQAGRIPGRALGQKDFRLPSGKVYSAAGMQVWPPANAIYRRETQDNYPAAYAILEAVYQGLQLPMDQASKVELRWFAKILRSKEAAAMIRTLFLSMQELNKGARRPKDIPPSQLRKVGIVGAGFMGASVAYVTANAGIPVVLIDRDMEAAEKGKAHSHKLMSDQIMKGRAKTADRDALLSRITPSADYAISRIAISSSRLFSRIPRSRRRSSRKSRRRSDPDCIFASNTSTLPISGLAKNSKHSDQFIGIHFFSPVEKMMLVEIILGKETGDKALATALDFVRPSRRRPSW